jgi:hypothetical protein
MQLLAVLLLSAICCASAFAATSPMTACDRTADLKSLEIPVSELSANVVGHIVAEPEEEKDEALTVLPVESTTPILDLAPRVTVILQVVFSAVAIETAPLDGNDSAETFAIDASLQEDLPLSPVADDARQSDSSEHGDPDSGLDDADPIPSLQRQMYRTDI